LNLQGVYYDKKKIVSFLAISLVSSSAFAFGDAQGLSAEERWNSLPEEKQARIAEKAAELGIDITTEEGRVAFREARKEQRTLRAAELGFDISTQEGRQAFREAKHEQRAAIREQIQALPEEDRVALREELQGLSRSERHEILATRFGSN